MDSGAVGEMPCGRMSPNLTFSDRIDVYMFEDILRKEGYIDILQNNAIPSAHRICQGQFVVQEDNDPKHSSKLYRTYLKSLQNERLC